MGLIDSMKSAIKGTAKWLRNKASPPATEPTAQVDLTTDTKPRNTTATRRAQRAANVRYAHVSVPMIRNPAHTLIAAELGEYAARSMGLTPFVRDVAQMPFGKGITLNKGIQAAKRRARQLGKDFGMSRKAYDQWAYDEAKGLKAC